MELRKKILSHVLLALYLLVVFHHCCSNVHASDFVDTPISKSSHQHEDFKDVHHDHHCHVGIFHMLGHLFEHINHTDDLSDDHLILVKKSPSNKVIDHTNPFNTYFDGDVNILLEKEIEPLPDPPAYLQFLQKLKLPSTPLRAPPVLV